jgi:c-di-GMP phosphodiesterase
MHLPEKSFMTPSHPPFVGYSADSACSAQTLLAISQEFYAPLTRLQTTLLLLGADPAGKHPEQDHHLLSLANHHVDQLLHLTTNLEQGLSSALDNLSIEDLAILRLETDLYNAIQHQELTLNYQPLVSLASGKITGFEALLRWNHATLGTIHPSSFIPIAEKNGLILELGHWVLQEACWQLGRWQQQFPTDFQDLSISVNLSSKQLAFPALLQQIQTALAQANLSAHHLKLEITESAVMENPRAAEWVMHQIRALGIQLYIDDFGTGYSSLSRLLELPLDVLKIDRSFVQKLSSDRGKSLIGTIATLAQNLGADVIAEGIETIEQMQHLQNLGCDRGQGYLFAMPLASDAVPPFILLSHRHS